MERKPLFIGYGWDIYEETQDNSIHAFGYHKACNSVGVKDTTPMNSWWLEDIRQECVMCGCKVPDGIQALITLYVYGKETP